MSVLFVQNWDVIPGKEADYERFVGDTFIPELTVHGLIPVGGYYVEVGFGPRVHVVHTTNEPEKLSIVIASREFRELTTELKQFVYNYKRYILEPTGTVKRGKYTIQKGVWKFNQYYDLLPGAKKEYASFIMNEHLPTMEKIEYVQVTGGWNVVLGGISEIIAEFTFKDPVDIGRLLGNEDFRRITLKLRSQYVTNYASRILRCMERFDEPKWFRL
jgi:hypothetical protein